MKYKIKPPRWKGYKVEWRNAAGMYQVSYWKEDTRIDKYFFTKEEVDNYIKNNGL